MFCTQAAEAGDLDEFVRLYQNNNTRLCVQDSKGRTAAHQAAARNRINILKYIKEQNGGNLAAGEIQYPLVYNCICSFHHSDLDIQDLAGNTPLHKAIEYDCLEAIECLLSL